MQSHQQALQHGAALFQCPLPLDLQALMPLKREYKFRKAPDAEA